MGQLRHTQLGKHMRVLRIYREGQSSLSCLPSVGTWPARALKPDSTPTQTQESRDTREGFSRKGRGPR
eukprot:5183885-Pyramimonas_sp.AAC.1